MNVAAFTPPRLTSTMQDSDADAAGYAAGYARGLRDAEAERAAERQAASELRTTLESAAAVQRDRGRAAIDAAVTAMRAAAMPVVEDCLDTVADTSARLVEAVLGVAVRDDELIGRAALRRVLDAADGDELVNVRVHHSVADTFRIAGVPVTVDPSLAPGDVVAELPHGFIDARLGTALARAREALGVA